MIMTAHKTSLLRPLLMAGTLAAGFGTLWFVLVLWLGTSILEAGPRHSRRTYESLVVTDEGTPLIQSIPLHNLSLASFRDLKGQVHEGVDRKHQLPAVYLYGEHDAGFSLFAQPNWQQRIKVFMDEREPAALWYFIHDGNAEGAGYFVGYERVSNRRIGYIGLSGFRPDSIPPDYRIPVRGEVSLGYTFWSSAPISIHSGTQWEMHPDRRDVPPRLVHVPSGNRLRLVDLSARTVATVFEAPAPIVAVGVPPLSSSSGSESTRERPILVRSGQKIYKLDHTYKVMSTFTMPPEIGRDSPVTWYDTDDGQAIAECALAWKDEEVLPDDAVTRKVVYQIAADGAIRQTFELSLQTGSTALSEQSQLSLAALAFPSPAILLLVESFLAILAKPSQGQAAAIGSMLKQSWPWMVAVLAASFVMAAITRRRARAFGFFPSEQNLWAGFVLIFGIPAYVGFLLHRLCLKII